MKGPLILVTALAISMSSCVCIEPSTVQSSAQVGERLGEMEKLNQHAIQRYFDMENQKLKDFPTNKSQPLLLRKFLGTSNVLTLSKNVSTIDNKGRSTLKQGIGPISH